MTSRTSPPSYPIHLRLAQRPVLVAGAGRVATRKIARLVASGAEVQVVAREASPQVSRLARAGKLRLSLREVEEADARDKFLIIAATDDADSNARLARAGRRFGALVARVDDPEDSDFSVPALVCSRAEPRASTAQGTRLRATISSEGTAPSASRRLARELGRWLAEGPDRFAAEIAAVRRALRGRPDAHARLARLAEGELLEACRRGDEAAIARLLAEASVPADAEAGAGGGG
jgi:siroheme synthase-like protein